MTQEHDMGTEVAGDGFAVCPVMPDQIVDKTEAERNGWYRDVDGRRYWLCCGGCVRDFDADPARHVAAAATLPTVAEVRAAGESAGASNAHHDHDHDHGALGGHDHSGHDHRAVAGDAPQATALDHAGQPSGSPAERDHHAHAHHDMRAGHDHGASATGAPHAGHDMGAGHGAHGGHAGHAGHGDHVGQFRRLFWIMLVVAVPVVGLSGMFAMLLGYSLPDQPWVPWVSPLLGTVMYFWGGWPFLTGAVSELRSRKPGMMLLIALAITVAYVASLGASLGLLDHELDFWWELALLIVIMLLGHWIEMRSLAQTTSALDSLAALLPDEAEMLHGEEIHKVSPSELKVGDLLLVRPGGRVPADGVVVSGSAGVDESMITGESVAVTRGEGDPVVAGSVATDSALRVRVTAVGEGTALAGIRRLVADAQASSSHAQRLADRAAALLFWFAIIAAVITIVVWSAVGLPDLGVVRMITVLVIACPHALGLAIPLVVSIATERAARGGVLIKDRLALEQMRTVDAVLLDKTGTLTVGAPAVRDVVAIAPGAEEELLRFAAAAERESEHPLARAIVEAAEGRGVDLPPATGFAADPAVGVRAQVKGKSVSVGGPRMLQTAGIAPIPETAAWHARGETVLHVLVDGRLIGAVGIADAIRPESKEAIDALHKLGRTVVMITGDAKPVADAVAAELGIDRVFAEVRPEDKAAKVRELQAEGKKVAMVGDGVNDAPALAQADVGIAIGAGTDVAIGSAGVILASSDPRSVLSVIQLSTASYRKMQQNLWWAAGYNLAAVPLAAGVLAPIGFVLPMSVGAILMSLSTILVALNAQLLRRLDLRPSASTRAILGSTADDSKEPANV